MTIFIRDGSLECVHCSSRFTSIKILKYLLPRVTFVTWGLFLCFIPGEAGSVLMSFSFCRMFNFSHRPLGGSSGVLCGIQELQIRPQGGSFSGK